MPTFLQYNSSQIIAAISVLTLIFIKLKRSEIITFRKWPVWLILFALFASLLYRTYFQWELFSAAPPAKYLLPPFAPWSYFIQYCWSWIWSQYILAFGGAAILFASISATTKEWRDVRFEEQEPLILSLGILLVGHPYWLFYFLTTLSLYLVYTLIKAWRFPGSQRVSFYGFYLPAALIVILLTPLLKTLPFMQVFSITL
jgi:hypothetical protein